MQLFMRKLYVLGLTNVIKCFFTFGRFFRKFVRGAYVIFEYSLLRRTTCPSGNCEPIAMLVLLIRSVILAR